MNRKTKGIVKLFLIIGIVFFFYHMGFHLLADMVTMTDEEYARAAQELVDNSLATCQLCEEAAQR